MTHNDNPFQRGDRVAVIRTRHGWHDGALSAVITSRWQNAQGTWSYMAEVEDTGEEVEIRRTKDARRK